MKIKNIVLLMLTLTTGLLQTNAQQVDSVQTKQVQSEKLDLSLAQAQAYATEHSKTMINADLEVKKAEIARKQAISNMLIQANATLSYTSYCGYEMAMMGYDISMPDYGQLGVTVSATIGGQMFMAVQLQKLAIEMQEISKESSDLDIKANTTTAYLSILIAEESARIVESTKENLERTYATVEQSAQVGMAEQTDADQIKVSLMVLDNNLRSIKRNIELANNSLKILIGAKPDAEITLTQDLDYFFETEDASKALESSGNIENNVNVRQLDKNIEICEKTINLNRWAWGPTLTAAYQLTKKTYFNQDAGMDMTPPNLIQISLNIPLFSSGKNHLEVQKSKIALIEAQNTREQTVDQLSVQESQLRFNLTNYIETMESDKQTLELNRKIFDNYLQKYNRGYISITDLITANNNLLTAESAYIQSLYNVTSAQTELLKFYSNL